jgi:endoglucanase
MGFVHADGTRLICDGETVFLRGFGLGGWLLPEGYMWKLDRPYDRPRRMEALVDRLCGSAYAKDFWRRYLGSYITERDIAWIASEGFNCVRLPINARHLDDGQAWEFIDACVTWGKKHHVYVMLDMHGAPGGQTGQNIDDCEHDQPELFQNPAYQDALVDHWQALAARYRDEETVVGYDLLNEPLPNFFAQYNAMLLPLYRRLAEAIRAVDPNHLLVLEGLHWATDFTVFEPLINCPLDGNMIIQFHKYWSEPDVESIRVYMEWASKLNVPLFEGESGENNLDWYAAAFPMYERNGISWSFWSYKKMDCDNSPVSFAMPDHWAKIQACAQGGSIPMAEAQGIFDALLQNIQNAAQNDAVIRALTKRAPICLPAEHFDACAGHASREGTAHYRMNEPVRIQFADGRRGKVNFDRNAGQPQPPSENLFVQLTAGEEVRYHFAVSGACAVRVLCKGQGELWICAGGTTVCHRLAADWQTAACVVPYTGNTLVVTLACTRGIAALEQICVLPA